MTDIKIDPQVDINLKYTTHKDLDQYNVKFRINRLIDENRILGKDSEKDFDVTNIQIIITAQVFINQRPVTPEKTTRLIRKMFIEEDIELPIKVPNLTYNAIVALKIWSLDHKHDEQRPLGSTIISLFDSDLKLREGKLNLLIWPDRLPDTSIDSTTPGLITDPNIDELNFYNTRMDSFDRQLRETNVLYNKCLQALRNQLFYAYRKIPAAFLEIEFPVFECPVLYEDIDLYIEPALGRDAAAPTLGSSGKYFLETSQFSNNIIFADYDQDNQRSNPVQEQYLQVLRFNDDARELKPQTEESNVIQKILKKPIFGLLTQEEKNLLWKFRYYLSEIKEAKMAKEALPKFLQCVNWSLEKESKEALSLLEQWTSIDYEDALHLLSNFFCANDVYNRTKKPIAKMMKVREYAMRILEKVSADKISFILLQLVQALRYEPLDDSSPLLNFLINRAQAYEDIAAALFWYLKVEVDTNTGQVGTFYQNCLQKFKTTLVETQEGQDVWEKIQEQSNFRDLLKYLNTKIKPAKKADKMKEELRKLLRDPNACSFKPHPMCIEPGLMITNFYPEECSCFKSAMVPLLISLGAYKIDGSKPEEHMKISQKSEKFHYKVMFKNGDDLRQDQLILQMISYMDSRLKAVNIDCKLNPYKALACSKEDGYIEFVSGSENLQAILKVHNDDLNPFFRELAKKAVENPDSWFYTTYLNADGKNDNMSGSLPDKQKLLEMAYGKIIENYIDSCAGYCVITYILGIGDRHLENLMINSEGKFFHIDFGWILGQDPKIQPPAFKLCKQMVEGMGGNKGLNYENFRKKCVVIFQHLRKYAIPITNMFHLMIDSRLPHLDDKGLERLWERFRLDETTEASENTILALIDESVDAFFSVVFDKLHYLASYWR